MVSMLSRKIANKAVESLNKTKHRDLYYILISFGLGLLFTLVGIYNIFTEATKDVTTRIIYFWESLCLELNLNKMNQKMEINSMTSEKEKMLAGHFHNEANFAVIFKYSLFYNFF
ncbi:hypothetical protein SMU21_08531 [Streptococcus mutans 1SM1]|nr:hypothetical protein SMU21_08531 [Streptococcus mutans 1SM1]